ncbi:MAG: hypothetical protein IT426_04610 [Pirellulales bacterium]|nr:hypothetical protein [Pirellulales bacterium]
MLRNLLLPLVLLAAEPAKSHAVENAIVLSEFQVWADAAGPETYRALNKRYLEKNSCHSFNLYPHYEYFVWDAERMKYWVDEAVALGAFNLFCIGDDTRTAKGHLFTAEGLNPELETTYFSIVEYAHRRKLMVAVEPHAMPKIRDEAHFAPWLEKWVGTEIPRARRADIIKLSVEWFGAYQNSPNMAHEVKAFFEACKKVNPEVLIYVDSTGGPWLKPQPFHRWLLHQYPGTILSHYLNTSQVGAFREMGARNMMVQINPCEIGPGACHLFLYFDKTVASLKDVVDKRVPYLSLAGVNYAYNRRDFDLFLDVIRPHLNLAPDVAALRKSIVPDEIEEPIDENEVKRLLLEGAAKEKQPASNQTPGPAGENP